MRDIYLDCRHNTLDQGMIFNGAISTQYTNANVLGIIITPRCDIAHAKTAEIHYLPIVSLEDWLAVDGKSILLEKVIQEQNQKLKSEFLKLKISESLMARNSCDELISILKELVQDHKQIQKSIQILERTKTIENIINSKANNAENIKLFKEEDKHVKTILKDLAENRRKEYYLLDPIDNKYFDFGDKYFVVLNREIKKIHFPLAVKLATGLDLNTVASIEYSTSDLNFQSSDGLLFCFKELKSPFIEHLIQNFLSNFNRIGVKDHEQNLHISLVSKINYEKISFC